MIEKILGCVVLMSFVVGITMVSVPPQERTGLQIMTYLLWLGAGAILGMTFYR